MKKGFTLIELLAVIVILAIIALIATPIVLIIINDTKESAILRSADFYLDGVETSIATSILKGITISDGTYSIMQDGYYFYVLSTNEDGTTNLIMDRNINNDGPPVTKAILESDKKANGGIYNLVDWYRDVGSVYDYGVRPVINLKL